MEYLFPHIGINNPTWTLDADGINNGSYGLYLTLREMVKLGQLKSSVLTRTGTIKGGKLLRPAEASEFFGHQVPEYDLPDWIALWIESDNTYPGF